MHRYALLPTLFAPLALAFLTGCEPGPAGPAPAATATPVAAPAPPAAVSLPAGARVDPTPGPSLPAPAAERPTPPAATPRAAAPAAQPAARAAAATGGMEWPQFRGPGGMGVSPDREAPLSWSGTEGIAWKAELPGRGTSSPIVHGPRIYLTCYGGTSDQPTRSLVCLDRATGKVVWQKDVPGNGPEEARIREDHG